MTKQLISSWVFFITSLLITPVFGSSLEVMHLEPLHWWVGMKDPSLQIMVHAEGVAEASAVTSKYQGVSIESFEKLTSPNYLFINLVIDSKAKAGIINFELTVKGKKYDLAYELKNRTKLAEGMKGFGPEDVIYLLMPDRFANGDPSNDNVKGMADAMSREGNLGRHGGDIQGITQHLDYIRDLGVTALWLNPVQENNMDHHSYHGYAMTDFYKVDARLGGNKAYEEMVSQAHQKGLKVIMDMVFNHCGSNHWWMKDLPSEDWVHQHENFTRSNFRATTIADPYASEYDRKKMLTGWFDTTMPDLNQKNPYMGNYLTQNSIWWIEQVGLDGIRMDTYPYPYKEFMADWAKRVMTEYPDFNIVGESWVQRVSLEAYWQKDAKLAGYQSNLPSVTDFQVFKAIGSAFHENEGWETGMANLYYTLTQDFLYPDPYNMVVFADNHDVTRIFTQLGRDYRKYKMAMAYLLTTRGIPQVYYGTEILMQGDAYDHGLLRKDYPGGWEGDAINVFKGKGMTGMQKDAHIFLKKLLNWRKGEPAVHRGKLTQFIPEDGIYVYFRQNAETTVMVVLNNNERADKTFTTERFAECMKGYGSALNIETEAIITDLSKIAIPAKSAMILELKK